MRLSTKEYKKRKEAVIKKLNITEAEYAELIKEDYHKGAGMMSSNHIVNLLMDGKTKVLDGRAVLEDWDFVWFYKRNLHVVLPEVEAYTFDTDGIDCLNFANMDKDVDIDTVLPTRHGPMVTYIRFIKRNIPVRFQKSICNCTIAVLHENGEELRFHFVISNKVRKIFLEKPNCCKDCNKCNRMKSTDGWEHVLRPRFRGGCCAEETFSEPFGILSIVAHVINIYLKREKLSKSKKVTAETKSLRAIMVARDDDDDKDTERLMPMFDYVKEYHESPTYEWKGGHHASPVSHPRSAYWRKAKHGTHILVNGEFVEVGRGLGKYVYVRSTIVNADKDSTLAEMV